MSRESPDDPKLFSHGTLPTTSAVSATGRRDNLLIIPAVSPDCFSGLISLEQTVGASKVLHDITAIGIGIVAPTLLKSRERKQDKTTTRASEG